jgi:CheY-like chemotaxis protein
MSSVILLVDDDAIQGITRKAILEQTGKRVVVAPSGQAALDLLSSAEMKHTIGLIVTDHLMPEMNGPELVLEIRRRGCEAPIVVLSGLPGAEKAYEDMNVNFRLKPCPPAALISLVWEMLCKPMSRTA